MTEHSRFRKYILVFGAIIALALILFGTMEYTSRSAFCIKCHEMKPVYAAWQSSGHGSVECMNCHSDPGPVGLLKTKTQALSEVYRHITNTYHKPITIDTDTSAFTTRCLRCHQDIKGQGSAHNNLHFTSNVNCTDCHLGLVHNPKTNKQPPSEQVCVKCHGNG